MCPNGQHLRPKHVLLQLKRLHLHARVRIGRGEQEKGGRAAGQGGAGWASAEPAKFYSLKYKRHVKPAQHHWRQQQHLGHREDSTEKVRPLRSCWRGEPSKSGFPAGLYPGCRCQHLLPGDSGLPPLCFRGPVSSGPEDISRHQAHSVTERRAVLLLLWAIFMAGSGLRGRGGRTEWRQTGKDRWVQGAHWGPRLQRETSQGLG